MNPDDLLEVYRESSGPDTDARARLMGRLAALGPPETGASKPRTLWPWVAAAATLAAAAVAFWLTPKAQRAVDEGPNASLASDRAAVSDTEGTAIPQAPREADPPLDDRRPEPALAPEPLPEPEPEREPEPVRPKRPRPAKPVPAPPADPPPVEVDTLAAEAALIGKARAALAKGDAAATLGHLRSYDATFDPPTFHEEAAALRAMARCSRDGRDDDTATGFRRAYPRSMFRKRVQKACAPPAAKKDDAE